MRENGLLYLWITKKFLGAGMSLKETKEKAEKKSKEYVFIKLAPFNVGYGAKL
jgi:hypothetical protein